MLLNFLGGGGDRGLDLETIYSNLLFWTTEYQVQDMYNCCYYFILHILSNLGLSPYKLQDCCCG